MARIFQNIYYYGEINTLDTWTYFFFWKDTVLVSSGYHNKVPQTGWLKKWKFICPSSMSCEVQEQGASWFGSWWELFLWLSAFLLCPHMGMGGEQGIETRVPLDELTYPYLLDPVFRHSHVEGQDFSTRLLGKHNWVHSRHILQLFYDASSVVPGLCLVRPVRGWSSKGPKREQSTKPTLLASAKTTEKHRCLCFSS